MAEPYWNLPEPPVQQSSIGVYPDVLKVFAEQNANITPISWSNKQYVANSVWGEYKYLILAGFGALAFILINKGR